MAVAVAGRGGVSPRWRDAAGRGGVSPRWRDAAAGTGDVSPRRRDAAEAATASCGQRELVISHGLIQLSPHPVLLLFSRAIFSYRLVTVEHSVAAEDVQLSASGTTRIWRRKSRELYWELRDGQPTAC